VVTWGLPTGGGDSRAVRQERCRDDLGGYPLVNIQKKYGTSPSLIAKFTIYIYIYKHVPFSIAIVKITRGYSMIISPQDILQ
jgi:hypothetical protein